MTAFLIPRTVTDLTDEDNYYLKSEVDALVSAGNEVAHPGRLYVQSNGNDTTGARGFSNKPFLTIAGAQAHALAGDYIGVGDGDYAPPTGSLLKDNQTYAGSGVPIPTNLANPAAMAQNGTRIVGQIKVAEGVAGVTTVPSGLVFKDFGIDTGSTYLGAGDAVDGIFILASKTNLCKNLTIKNISVLCKAASSLVHGVLVHCCEGVILDKIQTWYGTHGIAIRSSKVICSRCRGHGHQGDSIIVKCGGTSPDIPNDADNVIVVDWSAESVQANDGGGVVVYAEGNPVDRGYMAAVIIANGVCRGTTFGVLVISGDGGAVDGVTIDGNIFRVIQGAGITIGGSVRVNVRNNHVTGAGTDGFVVSGADGTVLTSNTADVCTRDGFRISGTSVVLSANVANSNGGYGYNALVLFKSMGNTGVGNALGLFGGVEVDSGIDLSAYARLDGATFTGEVNLGSDIRLVAVDSALTIDDGDGGQIAVTIAGQLNAGHLLCSDLDVDSTITIGDDVTITRVSGGVLQVGGAILASNLSGTNSGDQNLSAYQLASGLGSAAFVSTGTFAAASHNHAASAITSGTIADIYIASATTWNAKQAAITTGTTAQYFRGDLSLATLNATAVGLGSVENTALSTWAGSANITTLGTVTGTWQGTKVAVNYGGTNADLSATGGSTSFVRQVSAGAALTVGTIAVGDLPTVTVAKGGLNLTGIASGKLLYASATDTYAPLTLGTNLSITSGTLNAAGAGTPAGSGTEIQYRSGSSFGAITGSSTTSGSIGLTSYLRVITSAVDGVSSTGVGTFQGVDAYGQTLVLQSPVSSYNGNILFCFKAIGGNGQALLCGTKFTSDIPQYWNWVNSNLIDRMRVMADGTLLVSKAATTAQAFLGSDDGVHALQVTGGIKGTSITLGGINRTTWGATTLFNHYADVSNTGTSETDLYSDTLAAGQFAANGDKVHVQYSGTISGAVSSTQQIKADVAGIVVFDSSALAFGVGTNSFNLEINVIRESSSTLRVTALITTSYTMLLASSTYTKITGLTLANTQIIKITGTAGGVAGASNQITASMGHVEYKGA